MSNGLGSDRTDASETEIPSLFVNLVESGCAGVQSDDRPNPTTVVVAAVVIETPEVVQAPVHLGSIRIVALYDLSSTSYQLHEEIRWLYV